MCTTGLLWCLCPATGTHSWAFGYQAALLDMSNLERGHSSDVLVLEFEEPTLVCLKNQIEKVSSTSKRDK